MSYMTPEEFADAVFGFDESEDKSQNRDITAMDRRPLYYVRSSMVVWPGTREYKVASALERYQLTEDKEVVVCITDGKTHITKWRMPNALASRWLLWLDIVCNMICRTPAGREAFVQIVCHFVDPVFPGDVSYLTYYARDEDYDEVKIEVANNVFRSFHAPPGLGASFASIMERIRRYAKPADYLVFVSLVWDDDAVYPVCQGWAGPGHVRWVRTMCDNGMWYSTAVGDCLPELHVLSTGFHRLMVASGQLDKWLAFRRQREIAATRVVGGARNRIAHARKRTNAVRVPFRIFERIKDWHVPREVEQLGLRFGIPAGCHPLPVDVVRVVYVTGMRHMSALYGHRTALDKMGYLHVCLMSLQLTLRLSIMPNQVNDCVHITDEVMRYLCGMPDYMVDMEPVELYKSLHDVCELPFAAFQTMEPRALRRPAPKETPIDDAAGICAHNARAKARRARAIAQMVGDSFEASWAEKEIQMNEMVLRHWQPSVQHCLDTFSLSLGGLEELVLNQPGGMWDIPLCYAHLREAALASLTLETGPFLDTYRLDLNNRFMDNVTVGLHYPVPKPRYQLEERIATAVIAERGTVIPSQPAPHGAVVCSSRFMLRRRLKAFDPERAICPFWLTAGVPARIALGFRSRDLATQWQTSSACARFALMLFTWMMGGSNPRNDIGDVNHLLRRPLPFRVQHSILTYMTDEEVFDYVKRIPVNRVLLRRVEIGVDCDCVDCLLYLSERTIAKPVRATIVSDKYAYLKNALWEGGREYCLPNALGSMFVDPDFFTLPDVYR